MFIRQHHRNTDNISQIEGHYGIIGITINTCKHKQNHFKKKMIDKYFIETCIL